MGSSSRTGPEIPMRTRPRSVSKPGHRSLLARKHLVAQDLAERVARELVDEVHARGRLCGASASAAWANRLSSSTGPSATTTAVTISPQSSDGIPTTATSATPGCSSKTSSTSRGYTLKPPEMMSSLLRPTMRRYPSSSNEPMSPLRNQPSTNASRVASGRRQYPGNTLGPRSRISPPSECASLPLSSRRTSTPGSGKPTVPARRSPSYGFDTFINVSVMP